MVWCPLNRGVINLYRYRAVSRAANGRYLEALSVVDNPAWPYRQIEELTKPVVLASSRSHAGYDPASGLNVKLFGAVLDGDHLVRGFRNSDSILQCPRTARANRKVNYDLIQRDALKVRHR